MPPEGLTPTAYFDAAFNLLAENGHDGLTIAALCQQLGVTKGSFYHHFRDFSDFVDVLLHFWAAEHATRLIELSEAESDVVARLEVLRGIAIGLPHGAEAAIRAWSWSNTSVAAVQHAVDVARLAHLTQAGEDIGLDTARARLMAKASLSMLIGLQQLDRPTDPAVMDEVFGILQSWTVGSVVAP